MTFSGATSRLLQNYFGITETLLKNYPAQGPLPIQTSSLLQDLLTPTSRLLQEYLPDYFKPVSRQIF